MSFIIFELSNVADKRVSFLSNICKAYRLHALQTPVVCFELRVFPLTSILEAIEKHINTI